MPASAWAFVATGPAAGRHRKQMAANDLTIIHTTPRCLGCRAFHTASVAATRPGPPVVSKRGLVLQRRRAVDAAFAKGVPAPPVENLPRKQACAQIAEQPAAIELAGGVRYTGTRLIRGEIRGGRTFGPGAASKIGATIITCDHSGTYRCLRRSRPWPISLPRPAISHATRSNRRAPRSTISQ